MKKNNSRVSDETETVSFDTNNENTSIHKQNTSKEASSIDEIPDINDVLTSSGIFSYPLLEEFLNGEEQRSSILNEVEFVTGKYGPTVGLRLEDTWYRSGSNTILDETRKLYESKNIPCNVCVAKRQGKNGRIYYTLRGGIKE